MKVDVNQLAAHFAHIPFQVEGIYRYASNPGVPHADYTDSLPGFVFPLTGKIQFHFDGTPYIFSPVVVVHGGAKMKLDQTVFNKNDWSISWFYTEYVVQIWKSQASLISILNYQRANPLV